MKQVAHLDLPLASSHGVTLTIIRRTTCVQNCFTIKPVYQSCKKVFRELFAWHQKLCFTVYSIADENSEMLFTFVSSSVVTSAERNC